MEPPAVRRRGAEDLISRLPEELLHAILVRLPSAAAAARTSVLSRRWRGVWAHMPELALCDSPAPSPPPSALLDSIDAALNSYAAPTLQSLTIDVGGVARCDVPAHRVAPWLRFASQRLAGKLSLCLDLKEDAQRDRAGDVGEELALPICERATEIDLDLLAYNIVFRPPPTGSFSALTKLNIACNQMDGGELGRVVSSPRSPRLRKLHIFVARLTPARDVSGPVPVCDFSLRSESLECLEYNVLNSGKLEVTAPMLQEISVSDAAEACIVAPKLEKVQWSGRYNPALHQLGVAGRNLLSLSIMHSSFFGILISSTQLMDRYDTVKELKITLALCQTTAAYVTFLKEMDKLPICESLVISFMVNNHALPAIMLHLLRRCSCIRKLKLFLARRYPSKVTSCSISGCPCLLPVNYRLDDITFDSLEEIEIGCFTGSDEEEKFMKLLLSKCNTIITLKRVDIMVQSTTASSEIMEIVERIRSVCHPTSKVQFNVHAKKPLKLLAS